MTPETVRIAVDIGGTFIDAVAFEETTKRTWLYKIPTTPSSLAEGVLVAMAGLGVGFDRMETFIHGTTLGLNAILEHRGAKVGIITNKGFRDILEIGRGDVPPREMYNFQYQRPPLLVRRRLIFGVGGRVNYRGDVIEDLDETEVLWAARALVEDAEVESIAIVFLHSYVNPEHEQRAAALIQRVYPHISVSISSDIIQEYREYERTSTTVLDAYIRPIFERYVSELEERLAAAGFKGSFLITRSGGGAMTAAAAKKSPLVTVLSGPAGGIIGTSVIASLLNRQNVISFDVGGTSADTCVIQDGKPTEVYEAQVEHYPLLIPVYDIRTIGAGGGSIAWIDDGLLKVGPQSAGAVPGPICYGKGGIAPTVTDAALVLGYLRPASFLEGQMVLEEYAAREGISKEIAEPLGLDLISAAAAIFNVMLSRTVGSVREITVERGKDPREFSLVAFGGAGPMVAPMLMREMNIAEVIVPRAPAAFSAWGMLMADIEFDFSRTVLMILNSDTFKVLPVLFAELELRGDKSLAEQQVEGSNRILEHWLDLRYLGQEHALSIPIDGIGQVEEIQRRFEQAHYERYGHRLDAPIEILTLRLHAVGRTSKPTLEPSSSKPVNGVTSRATQQEAYDFATGQMVTFIIYDRHDLLPYRQIAGPAIIEEGTCTVVVHSDQYVETDCYGHLIIRNKVA